MIDPFAESGLRAPGQPLAGHALGCARGAGPLFFRDDKPRHTPLAAARRARQPCKEPETGGPARRQIGAIFGIVPFWSFGRSRPLAYGAVSADRHFNRQGAHDARCMTGMRSERAPALGSVAGQPWGRRHGALLRSVASFRRGAHVAPLRSRHEIENSTEHSVRVFILDQVRPLLRAGSVPVAAGFAGFIKRTEPVFEPHCVLGAGFYAVGRNRPGRMVWVLMRQAGAGGSL